MLRRIVIVLALAATAVVSEASLRQRAHPVPVVVHEWGTFTTVAGADGRPVDWLPLSGPDDLPCFVHRYRNDPRIKIAPTVDARPLDYEKARASLVGRVRMETPVLYFYAPQETVVDVEVRFPRGLMTEWYPQATVAQGIVSRATLGNPEYTGQIRWNDVRIMPGDTAVFPAGEHDSHYYAARATDAPPLRRADEVEKFLFYRGVAGFDVPITVALENEHTLRVRNLAREAFSHMVVFDNRGGSIGFRVQRALRGDMVVAVPGRGGDMGVLRAELIRMLAEAGLYRREAVAMVNTWRDSWFEEGTRVFYVLAGRNVDELLPLTVSPVPVDVKRVFVGRVEVVTPRIERDVATAIAGNDRNIVGRYGRLIGPVIDRLLARTGTHADSLRITRFRNAAFGAYVNRDWICE